MLRPAIIQAGKRMVHLTAKQEKLEKNCLYFSASKNNSTKIRAKCSRKHNPKQNSIVSSKRYYTTYNEDKLKKNEEPIPIKTMLKTFFRLVHPDFFSDYPAEKEENEKSFQALQSFLNSFQEMRPTLEVYDMHFYLRSLEEDKPTQQVSPTPVPKAEEKTPEKIEKNIDGNSGAKEQTEKKTAENQKPKFRQVAIKFTSPDPTSTMDAKDKYLERCLARLFTMCGMTSPITAQGYSSGVAMSDVNFQAAKQADPVGLVNYLNKTCAYAKQRTRERVNYERQVDFARSALYIQFKVKIVFEIPAEELPNNVITQLQNQYELLIKLERALKTYQTADPKGIENLAKVAVVFGKSTGVDKMGRANIIYTDSEAQWIETLQKVSGETIAKIRENAKLRSEKEKEVGNLLGVAYFYSDYHVSSSDEYAEFLDKVAVEFKATKSQYKFPTIKDGLRSLKIRVVNPVDTPSIRPYSVDYYICVIVIPMGCQPSQLFEFIEERGFETVNKYNEGLKESGLLHSHINKVKTSLRLRALTYESDIRSKDLISCLARLTVHFSKIDLQLDGVRLHIGHQYDLRKEDGTITIRWNYAL